MVKNKQKIKKSDFPEIKGSIKNICEPSLDKTGKKESSISFAINNTLRIKTIKALQIA